MNHDAVIGAIGYLLGRALEFGVNRAADFYISNWPKPRPVEAPLTVPKYYGAPYVKEQTHIERVTEMLDSFEVKHER